VDWTRWIKYKNVRLLPVDVLVKTVNGHIPYSVQSGPKKAVPQF